MKRLLDREQRLFLLGSILLLLFLFLRPVYVAPERQIANELNWPEERVNIFFRQEFGEQQLLCFHLEGSTELGYALATTGKYPEIERIKTSRDKLVERGNHIWKSLPLLLDGESYHLFLSLNEQLAEIRYTKANTSASHPITGTPAALLIPDALSPGVYTYQFFDQYGNELN